MDPFIAICVSEKNASNDWNNIYAGTCYAAGHLRARIWVRPGCVDVVFVVAFVALVVGVVQ